MNIKKRFNWRSMRDEWVEAEKAFFFCLHCDLKINLSIAFLLRCSYILIMFSKSKTRKLYTKLKWGEEESAEVRALKIDGDYNQSFSFQRRMCKTFMCFTRRRYRKTFFSLSIQRKHDGMELFINHFTHFRLFNKII